MSLARFLGLLALCSLALGCSKSKSESPGRADATRSSRVAANQRASSDHREAPADSGKVVQAVHLQTQAAELPAANAPSLFEGLSARESNEGPKCGCQEASRVLDEAIKTLKTRLTVISHNLANAETVAFKGSRVAIESSGYEQVKLPGAQDAFNNYAPASVAVGRGCRVQSVETDFSQGPLQETGRTLDVAIEGEGFFQVIDPSTNDFNYTRAGNFAINANGLLVVNSSSTGRLVQPQISIPTDVTGIVISAEGNVSIKQFGQKQYSQVGQIQLAKFPNPQGLLALGENLYQETLASGTPIFGQPGMNGLGMLRHKALEQANVDFDAELLAWEATNRSLQALERLKCGSPAARQ